MLGLGGASSDAAVVLRGLNILLDGPLSVSAMMRLGAELGSDVRFSSLEQCGTGLGKGGSDPAAQPARCKRGSAGRSGGAIATEWAYGVLAAHRKSRGNPVGFSAHSTRPKRGQGGPRSNRMREMTSRRRSFRSDLTCQGEGGSRGGRCPTSLALGKRFSSLRRLRDRTGSRGRRSRGPQADSRRSDP